jgi:hypothetical protein
MPMEDDNTVTPQAQAGTIPPEYVRMEYTGTRQGSVTYSGLQGRTYRVGNNASHRHLNVHRADVDKLLSIGDFRVIERPANVEPAQVAKPASPPKTEAELQAEAANNLLRAKEEARQMVELSLVPEGPPVEEVVKRVKPKGKRGKRA